jgi:serine/threonine-protein phosphatase 2A activator
VAASRSAKAAEADGNRYIQVMRSLQSSYWLEPAGSHGVWGLDDYHFLPFLFGAAQLRGTSVYERRVGRRQKLNFTQGTSTFAPARFTMPRSWTSTHASTCTLHASSSSTLCGLSPPIFASRLTPGAQVKTASLRWHSPMLDDISAVKTWDKVNSGMQKMYAAEVLGKLPVAQHFLFGSLLPYTGPPPPAMAVGADGPPLGASPFAAAHAHDGHAHPHTRTVHPKVTNGLPAPKEGQERQADTWGDCCGIPVPSAFGAAGAQPGAPLAGPTIRPVPFD